MKKKYADYSKDNNILEKEYKKLDTPNDPYFGAITLVNITKVKEKTIVTRDNGEEYIILDDGYKRLNMYPKEENFVIIAIYDIKSNLVEFYFDISKDIKYKPKVPVIKDLYLDVVITKNNYVEFIDEPELEEAYKMADIKQEDYELARKTADKIVNKFHNPKEFEKLKQTASDYLDKLMRMEAD